LTLVDQPSARVLAREERVAPRWCPDPVHSRSVGKLGPAQHPLNERPGSHPPPAGRGRSHRSPRPRRVSTFPREPPPARRAKGEQQHPVRPRRPNSERRCSHRFQEQRLAPVALSSRNHAQGLRGRATSSHTAPPPERLLPTEADRRPPVSGLRPAEPTAPRPVRRDARTPKPSPYDFRRVPPRRDTSAPRAVGPRAERESFPRTAHSVPWQPPTRDGPMAGRELPPRGGLSIPGDPDHGSTSRPASRPATASSSTRRSRSSSPSGRPAWASTARLPSPRAPGNRRRGRPPRPRPPARPWPFNASGSTGSSLQPR